MASHQLLLIRKATADDCPQILAFIRELADYEQLLHEVVATRESLEETLFGEHPQARVLMAEKGGQGVGFALYHTMYSTFIARPGIYLEDLYVSPDYRGQGIGKSLLAYLARETVEEGHCRLDWSCLKWNEPSLAFYRSIGALELEDWTRLRLQGEALEAMANT